MALRSIGSRIMWALFKQETVGVDAVGNKYWRKLEKQVDGEVVEKRFVKLADEYYDPNAIPPEWNAWLRKTRHDPPSSLDIDKGTAALEQQRQQAEEAARAAELADRRFREQSSASSSGTGFKHQLHDGDK